MTKIKEELSKQKHNYLKRINVTEILDPNKDKENINIEYIVDQLQRKRQK